jgi:hypothetical protein
VEFGATVGIERPEVLAREDIDVHAMSIKDLALTLPAYA